MTFLEPDPYSVGRREGAWHATAKWGYTIMPDGFHGVRFFF